VKKLLIVVGAAIVALIVAVAVAPFLISTDAYKGEILARVRDATGREIWIGGPLSLSLFPTVTIAASDVSLSNAPGAVSPTMTKLRKLELAVKLVPLLSGRIEVERLVLVDPAIDLEIDAQGRPNWSFAESGAALPAAAPGATPPKSPSMMGLAALSRLRVKDVTIENGDIVLLDRRSGRREELRQVAVTLSAPSLDAPFAMDGSALWRGEKIAFSAKLDNTAALLMRAGGESGLTASLTAKPMALTFTGGVADAEVGGKATLVFDGDAELTVPSLRDFIRWSGRDIALPKHGFGALSASGAVHAENAVAKFSNGSFSLDAVKATGTLTLDVTVAKPRIAGVLRTGMLDLNPYLPPPVPGWNADAFDTAIFRQVDADFDVAADGAKFRRLQIGRSHALVRLKDGKLTLDADSVSLYRGSASAEVTLDANGPAAAIVMNGAVSGVDLGALLRDAGGGGVAGSGSFTFACAARGNSERDLVSTLGGKASFRVANGSLGGVDLGGMMRNAASSFAGGGTTIRQAGASYAIRNGIMRTGDLAVGTGSMDATGAGTVNLPARTLDYRIEPKFIAGIVTLPVIVSGPWDRIGFQPDLAGIAKGIVTAPVNAIGGAAGVGGKVGQGIGAGVGGALKGLFGN
jgi:AsmA protein